MAQQYRFLLFDLDDTLIDDKKSKQYAYQKIIEKLDNQKEALSFEEFFRYDQIYWDQVEKGMILLPTSLKNADIKQQINYYRQRWFHDFFRVSLEDAYYLYYHIYHQYLSHHTVPTEEYYEVLNYLKGKYELVIATNGPTKPAFEKLERAHLDPYFKWVFSSEEIGYAKPKREFFEAIKSKLSAPSTELLMIGDSFPTDIIGAHNADIDAIWYQPRSHVKTLKRPTNIICSFEELKERL